jgi:predicted Abi (CAAX) family protease
MQALEYCNTIALVTMTGYLRKNFIESFRTSPFQAPLKTWALVPLFVFISITVGLWAGLLKVELLNSKFAPLLLVSLFIFPSLLEEAFFRGILIPRNILRSGASKTTLAVTVSTMAFVVWHPANALVFNQSAILLFLNPWFLVIVSALGLTCGYSYVVSRSIWVPVIIHWATVTIWVFFLGGRNLILVL